MSEVRMISTSGILEVTLGIMFGDADTFERRIASGAIGDTDVYGPQQHAPLLDIEIPF
jgi:hypothetical protein